VPLVVIVPPVKPVPAVIEVTVPEPPPPVAVIVVTPEVVLREIPEPAERTAATSFVMVGMPGVLRSTPEPATNGK
jgi:hypothetical protein